MPCNPLECNDFPRLDAISRRPIESPFVTARDPRRRARPAGLSPRAASVLRGVIAGYLRTGAAIASDAAVKHGRLEVSPATVRVVMGELTTAGLLAQPHASAGRMPTEAGLRLYVDHLLRPRAPSAQDRSALDATLQAAGERPAEVVRAASRHLAGACTLAAVGRRPRLGDALVQRIELLPLDRERVLAVCVFADGEVQSRVVRLAEPADEALLERARNLFVERWSGQPLSAIRRALRAQIEEAEGADPERRLLEVGEQALPEAESPDEAVVVEGRAHLLDREADPERLQAVLAALEDKRLLLRLLDGVAADGPRVVFGGETGQPALRACTLICAPYGDGVRPMGAVAILGPVRMNYSRIIPWVGYTADAISGILHATRAA